MHEATARLRTVGPDRVSVRDLANALSTSTNAIYSIFGGKDPLLAAVAERACAELHARQVAAAASGAGADGVRAAARDQRAWALENPGHHLLLRGLVGDASSEELAAADDPLVPLVASCVADGTCAPGDPVEIVATIRAAVHGYVTLELHRTASGPDPEDADARFEAHLWRLLRGVLAPVSAVA